MTNNREVITGGDFKRMVSGAYSEFLLEYNEINQATGGLSSGQLPGTHILRTLGAAIMPLANISDDSIGGLSRRVATAAMFGARGTSGVILSQLFRGMAKGLSGKYNATSSEFGKAFQYGILFAQRVLPEHPDRPFIAAARAVAKGAYHAVRANLPITEILEAAIKAGEATGDSRQSVGEMIMFAFLVGCLKGLDGNFVSPAVSLSLGLTAGQDNLPDPRFDLVRPYCVTLKILNSQADISDLEKQLKEYGNFALVSKCHKGYNIHLHTDEVGKVLDNAIGWGQLKDINITDMSEAHVLKAHDALVPVAVVAVSSDDDEAEHLQKNGVSIIVRGSELNCPSVAELVSAAHSDLASSYVMVASCPDYWLVFQQAKQILGNRVELVCCENRHGQDAALSVFDAEKNAADNAAAMGKAASWGK